MKFLVDHQLPAVLDVGLAEASDTEIWNYASRNDCVLISKDEDFLYLANAPGAKAPFVWIRFGNCRKKALLAAIETLWPKVVAGLKAGDRVIELRK